VLFVLGRRRPRLAVADGAEAAPDEVPPVSS